MAAGLLVLTASLIAKSGYWGGILAEVLGSIGAALAAAAVVIGTMIMAQGQTLQGLMFVIGGGLLVWGGINAALNGAQALTGEQGTLAHTAQEAANNLQNGGMQVTSFNSETGNLTQTYINGNSVSTFTTPLNSITTTPTVAQFNAIGNPPVISSAPSGLISPTPLGPSPSALTAPSNSAINNISSDPTSLYS